MQQAQATIDNDELLTEMAVARLLCLSVRTLQAWRITGAGPAYVRAGRAIRYRRRDVLEWIESNTVGGARRCDIKTVCR